MKRWWWIGSILLVAAVGAGVAVARLGHGSPWTSDVPAARAALEAALDARSKVYETDVPRHLERALELDPDFLAAKAMLAFEYGQVLDSERRQRLRAEVESAPLDDLSEEERFRIRYLLLRGDPPAREELVDEYLRDHPKDVYALHLKAQRAMAGGRLEEAEALHRQTLELNPNWVLAHNQLGYLTMERGDFEEAENHFVTYRFIAPDQANPHDSLGELYTLLGRYDEASAAYRAAIAAKADFCPAWAHLVMNHMMAGELDHARTAVAQMQAARGCPEPAAAAMVCTADVSALAQERRWEEIVARAEGGCASALDDGYVLATAHRAAALSGRVELALELEQRLAERPRSKEQEPEALVQHMAGVRLAVAGELAAAAAQLRTADERLRYRGNGEGLLKLVNRIALAEVLSAAGSDDAASEVRAEVAAVNPRLVRHLAEGGGLLGLAPAP